MLTMLAAAAISSTTEMARWQSEARNVTITRDDWGIAHVVGKSDADAVFGMIYAQAEDDFNRVETNYLWALGRQSEAGIPDKYWDDVRARLFIDSDDLKNKYQQAPNWLKKLMNGWADGLNYYLATHPETHPKLLKHFDPWMPLALSEGSIGADFERANTRGIEEIYDASRVGSLQFAVSSSEGNGDSSKLSSNRAATNDEAGSGLPTANCVLPTPEAPTGSNGIVIGPSNTRDHRSLLLINPHTSFFFRSELHMTSEEGLNAYGAVTWGQFFVYQGFNDRCGWMHTSSQVDAVDQYLETVTEKDGHYFYKYGDEQRPVKQKLISVVRLDGKTDIRTVYFTRHGPVIAQRGDKWVTMQLMNRPVQALEQSFLRTKAQNYRQYRQTMDLRANSSNNTLYADADGDIAYFHADFIPKRDDRFDFTKPLDGTNPATDWHGLLTVDQTPHLLNPASGYAFNVNDSPWQGSGASSLKQSDFPRYVDHGAILERTIHCERLLANKTDYTLESLLAAAFDRYLPWFQKPIPALLKAWDETTDFELKTKTAEPIAELRKWDLGWGADSISTSLAIFWGDRLKASLGREAAASNLSVEEFAGTKATAKELLLALAAACQKLAGDFGTWRTPWGVINRFQRITDDINPKFDDAGPSIPIPFTASDWGSLAAFGARPYPGAKKWYGTSGNSFVTVVQFGPKVRAVAITAGGESGHPGARHFNDEAQRYAGGQLREVYFYPEQLKGHTEGTYHPG